MSDDALLRRIRAVLVTCYCDTAEDLVKPERSTVLARRIAEIDARLGQEAVGIEP
jgi:hypothetical protein